MNKQLKKFGAIAAGATLAAPAFAVVTPIDVTDVVATIAAAATPIGLIGSGVLLVVVALKTFKWVRRAM